MPATLVLVLQVEPWESPGFAVTAGLGAAAAVEVDGFAAPALPYGRRVVTVPQPPRPAQTAAGAVAGGQAGPVLRPVRHGQPRGGHSTRGGHGAKIMAWEAQLVRLVAYKAEHGDCNVPTRWAEDPPLGSWVSNQRAYKKALDRGDPSIGMTAARAARLEALGFAWALSINGNKRTASTNEGV